MRLRTTGRLRPRPRLPRAGAGAWTPGVLERLYPEVAAGGFARNDQRVTFHTRVNALLRPGDTVLDFGAGNGSWAGRCGDRKRALCDLRGEGRHVIGVDVSPAVHLNPTVDWPLVVPPGERLPLDNASVDLITSWAVFEHVEHPGTVATELTRVLRPGGWLCAWTPNRWGYVGLGGRLVPNRLHARLARSIAPEDTRGEADVFPTHYRMNTLRRIRELFPEPGWRHHSYVWNGPPAYHAGSVAVARLLQLWGRLLPPRLGQSLHLFLRRL